MRAVRIRVYGIVQGVGFRPFVYRIANERHLRGWVTNDTLGVEIAVSGEDDRVEDFMVALREEHPPQAVVERIEVEDMPRLQVSGFTILPSRDRGDRKVLVSPDLATCPECLRELFDPSDRRYSYPFINCTNCGPRFTIIHKTPYDRHNTSMRDFNMCPLCDAEYNDPSDRRYHAQPNACPACGPSVWLTDGRGEIVEGDPINLARDFILDGKIVAIKGLGGFHLACNATDDLAVSELRKRKKRYEKPLAVMMRDLETVRRYCYLETEEEVLLESPAAPIVLLKEREGSDISRLVAGFLEEQGVFLPYTPLHHLLMSGLDVPLVMTSGNMSSEPIARDNHEALSRLSEIADFFLLHDRDIVVRYDDSVMRVFEGLPYPVRRSRGYAPYPLSVNYEGEAEVLAVGPDLKNTFCLLRKGQAFVGQHIGDIESFLELEHFHEALKKIKVLFSIDPVVVAHDMHPDYFTTGIAREFGLPLVPVQHHHAHVVSCLVDNGVEGSVIGVAFDGTGYGTDGTIWGGEFLLVDENGFERVGRLYPYPMPGGDACIYRPYRMLYSILNEALGDFERASEIVNEVAGVPEEELAALSFQLKHGFNTPLTSGAGRLFDAMAVLTGLRRVCSHDAQAAMELEAAAVFSDDGYSFELIEDEGLLTVDTRSIFAEAYEDLRKGTEPPVVAGKFHGSLCRIIENVVSRLCGMTGVRRVALSGGVFQNMKLLRGVFSSLRTHGLEVLVHRRVPCNDGGVSLGQAFIAGWVWSKTGG